MIGTSRFIKTAAIILKELLVGYKYVVLPACFSEEKSAQRTSYHSWHFVLLILTPYHVLPYGHTWFAAVAKITSYILTDGML